MARAFLLELAPSVPSLTNVLLFELLVIGVVQDRRTGKVLAFFLFFVLCALFIGATSPMLLQLYKRSPKDTFLVKIANTPGHLLRERLRICSLFPQHKVRICSAAPAVWSLDPSPSPLSLNRFGGSFLCRSPLELRTGVS